MSGGAATTQVFFDTCTLENFAVVERLDLVGGFYADRCMWMTAVADEVRSRVAEQPNLGAVYKWFGEPIEVSDPLTWKEIDQVRRAGLNGSPTRPMEHLGEAQTIQHLTGGQDKVFATDDRYAADLAKRRGIKVIDTCDILAACYEARLVGHPDAFELVKRMASLGRGVAVPSGCWYVCPAQP